MAPKSINVPKSGCRNSPYISELFISSIAKKIMSITHIIKMKEKNVKVGQHVIFKNKQKFSFLGLVGLLSGFTINKL